MSTITLRSLHLKADEIKKVAKQLIELKRKGYPIMNSTNYFKVIAKEKNWKCKPWSIINIGTDGRLVLPCYVLNQYETSASVFDSSIKAATSSFDWKVTHNCVKCNLHCYVEPSLGAFMGSTKLDRLGFPS